ncbi:hypothetical protein GCM10010353_27470 [Streptomyces chryseus]|nr:hypothetical protein GCM10010353_27470 [Streptomyces chryseus]
MPYVDQPAVEVRHGHVRQYGLPGRHRLAARRAHGHGPPRPYDDLDDALAAAHHAAPALQASYERGGELAGATGRHREAVTLAEHRHEPAETATARRLRGEVRVQGVAGQQQPARLAPELLLAQSAYREQHRPGQTQPARAAQPGREADAGAYGRERGEQGAEDVRTEPAPDVAQPLPRRAVASGELLQSGDGVRRAAFEDRAPPVGERMRQNGGGVAPAQPVLVQAQAGQHGGSGGQRIEGAEEVADEVGVDPPVAADGAARFRLGLQYLHGPAGVGQQVRCDEPVGARADDYGVRHR